MSYYNYEAILWIGFLLCQPLAFLYLLTFTLLGWGKFI